MSCVSVEERWSAATAELWLLGLSWSLLKIEIPAVAGQHFTTLQMSRNHLHVGTVRSRCVQPTAPEQLDSRRAGNRDPTLWRTTITRSKVGHLWWHAHTLIKGAAAFPWSKYRVHHPRGRRSASPYLETQEASTTVDRSPSKEQ